MSNDIAVAVGAISVPSTAANLRKTPVLIVIEDGLGVKKALKRFVALDLPEFLPQFVHAKGVFFDEPEQEVSKNFLELLTNTPTDHIVEMWFPVHKVVSLKNLIFKAKSSK